MRHSPVVATIAALVLTGVTAAVAGAHDLDHLYDANGNGIIDKKEVIAGVGDYFAGRITMEEMHELLRLYNIGIAQRYDTNGDGIISGDEFIVAVADHLSGELSRGDAIVLLRFYDSGRPYREQ